MCFLTKCPYVPPHEFNLDFPHLMLRYRAVAQKKGAVAWGERQLTETDRNGKLARTVAGQCNRSADNANRLTRSQMGHTVGVHRDARLPHHQARTDLPSVEWGKSVYGRVC